MKYYIISGEASGDLHGSNLVKHLKIQDPQAQIRAWGGELMQAQGAELVKHYRELAFMGFIEVIKNLRTIFKNMDFCEKDVLKYKPDVVIMIDYPGFNLRMAERLKKHGIKIFYYISPQVWAWKQSRVKKIKKFVDRMFVILPFEEAFYQKFDYKVDFVGHPLLDAIEEYRRHMPTFEEFAQKNNLDTKPIIALLPGSRKQEISIKLPIMLSVVNHFKDHQFVVAGAPSIPQEFYKGIILDANVAVVYGQTYQLLQHSTAALVTSGTATLETALFGVPEVVCYKGNRISYLIARQLIKVKYISLVNLIMDKEVVKELIQDELSTENVIFELNKLLNDETYRQAVLHDFSVLREKLGGPGASEKTARLMLKTLKELS